MSQQNNKLGLHLSVVSSLFGSLGKLSQEAEQSGYASLWVAEVAGPNAFVALAPCAMATKRVDLATGVVPIQIRTPGVLAMEAMALNELSGGRAIAGLGVSSPVIVERWHGASYRKPVTAMRECVHIMRELFTKGRCKFEGKVYKCDFRHSLVTSAPRPPRIYLAALNPPMLRLAGEVADGVLLNYSPSEAVPAMIAEVRAGAEQAGRNPADVDIAIYLRMCVTEDEDKALESFKRELAGYAFVDAYNEMFARYGLGDQFAEVRKLWREGKRDDAYKALSDADMRRIGAFGSAESGRDFVASFRAAGVKHPVIFPIGPGRTAERDFQNTMRAMVGA
ncbi:MAG: LLM class flavin-dependent oxidoreductase [Candidatus Binataceae bacterium]